MTHQEFMLNLTILGFKYAGTTKYKKYRYVNTDNVYITFFDSRLTTPQQIFVGKTIQGSNKPFTHSRTTDSYKVGIEYIEELNQ
jgi:hypothetical protein